MKKIVFGIFCLSLLLVTSAWAAPYDFRLVIYSTSSSATHTDQPYFELQNISDNGVQIDQFSITSGKPRHRI